MPVPVREASRKVLLEETSWWARNGAARPAVDEAGAERQQMDAGKAVGPIIEAAIDLPGPIANNTASDDHGAADDYATVDDDGAGMEGPDSPILALSPDSPTAAHAWTQAVAEELQRGSPEPPALSTEEIDIGFESSDAQVTDAGCPGLARTEPQPSPERLEASGPAEAQQEIDPADWKPPLPHFLIERSDFGQPTIQQSLMDRQPPSTVLDEPSEFDDDAALYDRTLERVRALVEKTGGQFVESTIPTVEVPPLASAVLRLRELQNRRTDALRAPGLQGKRLSIQTWYESAARGDAVG